MGITINLDLVIFALGSISLISLLIISVGVVMMVLYYSMAFLMDKIGKIIKRCTAGVE